MKSLMTVIVCSAALSACTGIKMKNFENKKSTHEQQEESFHIKTNRTKDVTANDNNARKLDTKIKSFESAKIFEHKKSRHEQKEENFHRKINKTKDIIENNARKQDPLYRNNNMSFPPYNASYAF